MESIERRLVHTIKEMSEIEVQELEIRFAKFNIELKTSYNEKIKIIENNLDSQFEFYGKSLDEYSQEREKILKKYSAEFQKVYNQRREQFFNIQIEIQEMQANQKIILANFKKIVDERTRFIDSKEFAEYIRKKQEYKSIVENSLKREEFDKYTQLLEELVNPLEVYQKKLVALVVKFDGYKELIKECEKKLEECIDSGKKDFEEIVRFRNASLSLKKKNIILIFLNTIANKIMKNKKFEKEVIQKMNQELKSIEEENNVSIEVINTQTLDLIAKIEDVRENLNKEFKLAVE